MPRIRKIEVETLVQTCANCGNEFEAETPRTYCSYECEQEADFKIKEARRIEVERLKAIREERERLQAERDAVIVEDAREVHVFFRQLTQVHGFARSEALSLMIGWQSAQGIKRMSTKE